MLRRRCTSALPCPAPSLAGSQPCDLLRPPAINFATSWAMARRWARSLSSRRGPAPARPPDPSFESHSFLDAYLAAPPPPPAMQQVVDVPPPVYEPASARTLAVSAKAPWLESPWAGSPSPRCAEEQHASPRPRRRSDDALSLILSPTLGAPTRGASAPLSWASSVSVLLPGS
jgi:hypothetical protein